MIIEGPTKPKVTYLDITVLGNKNICRFYIPVYYIDSMDIAERTQGVINYFYHMELTEVDFVL